ncbi:hypothetical protein SNEBB_007175 [Seison nebaliae]|nr:hypothetical protein SNEBB_007175 [Seison nebaliae]
MDQLKTHLMFDELKRMNRRQVLFQALNFGLIVSSALMIWKFMMVITGSGSPVVVVLSGSMEPAFFRGDLLLLRNIPEEPVTVGDIAVFKLKEREIPIVHRVISVHQNNDSDVHFLTKGDNNEVDDRALYDRGQLWLTKNELLGKPTGHLPYVGMVTIIMNDYPQLKIVVLGVLSLFVFLHREN